MGNKIARNCDGIDTRRLGDRGEYGNPRWLAVQKAATILAVGSLAKYTRRID
jgi:hypothetical protein